MPAPKTALFDLENSPSLGYYYDLWKEGNIVRTLEPWYLLSFSYQWLGQKKIHTHRLCDYPRFTSDKKNDIDLVKDLWKLFDEADILIAHNAKAFDVKKANQRFIYHSLPPPSPYKVYDTLLAARKVAKFDSNRLDSLARTLGVGAKLPTIGIDLWLACMAGPGPHWDAMGRYNAMDVKVLRRVYDRLKMWDGGHPKLTHFTRASACPTCQSPNIASRGYAFTATGKRQRISCRDCGAWSTTGPLIKDAA